MSAQLLDQLLSPYRTFGAGCEEELREIICRQADSDSIRRRMQAVREARRRERLEALLRQSPA